MAKKTGKSNGAQAAAAPKPRRLKIPPKLPSAWSLSKTTWRTLWRHKKLFFGITIIYGLLNLVLVQGLASHTDVTSLKQTFNQAFSGHFGSVASGVGVFVVLLGSAGNGSSQVAGAYQLFLGLITSLAVIWTLRQVLSGSAIRIRDAYYRGMYPLIPFLLVLFVIGLQLLPLLIGSALYSTAITNGIAVTAAEKIIVGLIFIALAVLSVYWISSSIFALYIAALPDMTPLKALRSARGLVSGRRWPVLRKLLCLPIILLVVTGIIIVPIIVVLTPLAQWIFFLLTMFALVFANAYLYILYRELLNE